MLKDFNRPLREEARKPCKTLVKKGTLEIGIVETTPVLWKDRLYRFEWIRNTQWGQPFLKPNEIGYYRFTDMETGESTPDFALNHSFGCAHIEGGKAYVHGVYGPGGGNRLDAFWSDDLVHWESKVIFDLPEGWSLFNTSVCKGPDGYIMTIEIGGPADICGIPFTIVFAKSQNLTDWEMLPPETYSYTKDRYSACPVIRYADGFYYIIYLESLPCHRWVPYIIRTQYFLEFELGLRNPVMFFDDNDKKVQRPDKFTQEELEYINSAIDCNNSDIDLCEFNGKTVILYSWGNQYGKEFLAEAEYDGSIEEFLKSFF
jgi:alpha-L-fucosidase